MAFTQRLSSIDLISSALTGMLASRKTLWRRTLDECKEEFEKRGLSASINSTASASIDALREKGTATSEGPAALGIYRYVGEGLTRSVLSMAYEDKLPFDWSCNWSAAALQEVMIRISSFLAPMTLHRRSRLLPSFPISVLGSIMDAVTSSGADKLHWWSDPENLLTVIRKAKNMAKGFSGRSVPEQEKNVIKIAVFTFAEGVRLLESLTGAKDFASLEKHAVSKVQQLMKRRYDDDRNSEVVPPFLFTKRKVLHIWHMVLDIDVTLGCEMGFLIDIQVTHLDGQQHSSSLTNICRNIVTKEGENENVTQLMSLDNFLLDVAYFCSDMFKTIDVLCSEDCENEVGHLMTVLAEPWEENKTCNHRKLFMLCAALTEGIRQDKIDNSLLVNAIMEKLDDTGKFSSMRKRRAKLTTRQSKRTPRLQPRVIYSRPLSDSEDEYTSRQNSRQRAGSRGRTGKRGNRKNRESDSSSESERQSPNPNKRTVDTATETPPSTPATPVSSAPQTAGRKLSSKRTGIPLPESFSSPRADIHSPSNGPPSRAVSPASTVSPSRTTAPPRNAPPRTPPPRTPPPPPSPVVSTPPQAPPTALQQTPPNERIITPRENRGDEILAEVGVEMSINEETSPMRVKKKRKRGEITSPSKETNVRQADSTEKDTTETDSGFLSLRKPRRSTRRRKTRKTSKR